MVFSYINFLSHLKINVNLSDYKIEDLESYVKKLKIDKQDKELINTMLIAAKLI